MKPTLCCDANLKKINFPILVQPKIDGVRSLNFTGTLTGRSLKLHGNYHVTEFFSDPIFQGFDGEMANESATHPDLCRLTSSALSKRQGTPYILWHLFDYITPFTQEQGYLDRYNALVQRLEALKQYPNLEHMWSRLRVVPSVLVHDMAELEDLELMYLQEGYEGVILRDPNGRFKQGRATAREGSYMRIKRFIDAEAELVDIVEGVTNNNEAQINELGKQFRSSHKENLIPNGTVGTLVGRLVDDVFDPITDIILFSKGDIVEVGPGKLTALERKQFFEQRKELTGQIFKFKTFPKGVKDKPRFPTFLTFRDTVDLVNE